MFTLYLYYILCYIKLYLEKLEIKCDVNKQYSRRSCLRIHDIELNPNENSNSVMNNNMLCHGSWEFNESKIDRVHYIGKPAISENTKEKYKLIIAEFKLWKLRMVSYKIFPKNYVERKKKRSQEKNLSFTWI